MIPRTIRQLFDGAAALAPQGWQFKLKGSAVEIYNETFKDLLDSDSLPDGKKHTVCVEAGGAWWEGWSGGKLRIQALAPHDQGLKGWNLHSRRR